MHGVRQVFMFLLLDNLRVTGRRLPAISWLILRPVTSSVTIVMDRTQSYMGLNIVYKSRQAAVERSLRPCRRMDSAMSGKVRVYTPDQ